jgi:transcriptional regulator with XRE-family HTH domain
MDHIRTIMARDNLSLSDVARRVKLSPAAVSRHLDGQRGLSAQSALKYSLGLGIPVGELLGADTAVNAAP